MAKKKATKRKSKVTSTKSKVETTRRYKNGTTVEVTKPVSNSRAKSLTRKTKKK